MNTANAASNHSLSAILWKLFIGGLLVDIITLAGLFVVGALSVIFRISSYNSLLLGFIPILLDALVIYGTIAVIGKIFFGRSGPLDKKRWERYLLGQIPGFLFGAFFFFLIIGLELPDLSSGFLGGILNNSSGYLFFAGAAVTGFAFGMFSVLTHHAKDIASARQAEAMNRTEQTGAEIPVEATEPTAPAAPAAAVPGSTTASTRPKTWLILFISLLVIGIVFVILWARNARNGFDPAAIPGSLPARAGEQESARPARLPAGCREWDEIRPSDAGKQVCAYGVVEAAYLGGEITYLVFTEDKRAFRLVNLAGDDYAAFVDRCVFAEGKVKTYGEIAYIEVTGPLDICE